MLKLIENFLFYPEKIQSRCDHNLGEEFNVNGINGYKTDLNGKKTIYIVMVIVVISIY